MKSFKFLFYFVLGMSFFLLSACDDEPKQITSVQTVDLALDDAFVVDNNSSHLMTVAVEYPKLSVSSIFSTNVKRPTISYLGSFSNIEEIPLLPVNATETSVDIHDGGGYLVELSVYDASIRDEVNYMVRILLSEIADDNGAVIGIRMQYQIAK